jgi:uroporphyrinogen decarboxylase
MLSISPKIGLRRLLVTLTEYFRSLHRRGVVPVLGYPGLTIENTTTQQCLLDPELHARVALSNVEHYGPDAALPLLDLTVEAESFGIKPIFNEREAPQIRSFLPLERVANESETPSTNRMPLMVEAARKISREVKSAPSGAYVTGPFTLAGQVVGIQPLLLGLYKQPKVISQLLERCTGTVVDYARHLADTGIDFLVVADPSSSLISPKQFDEFAKLPIAHVAKAISKEMILHICGHSGHLLQRMVETGVAALSLDNNVKLTDAVAAVPGDVLVFGNYPPTDLVFKRPETITAEVKQMLSPVAQAENVVVSTGCDIPATAPSANIHALIEAAKLS